MADEYNEPAQTPLDLKKYRDLMVRRRWYVVVPLFVVWGLIWTASWMMPSVYRSSTLILVLQPAVSESISGANPANDLQDRLEGITTQLRSRSVMLSLAQRFNPYPGKHMGDDALVAKMNKDLLIDPVRSPGRSDVSSFDISFEADTPQAAQEVTAELGEMLTSQSLEMKAQSDTNTVKFLDAQLEDARAKMDAQDAKVRDFKDRHMGSCIADAKQSSDPARLARTVTGRTGSVRAGGAAQSVAGVFADPVQIDCSGSAKTPGDPTPSGLSAIDAELAKEKDDLSDLLSKYTDQHPDVKKKREQIAETESRRAQRVAELRAQASQAAGHDTPGYGRLEQPDCSSGDGGGQSIKSQRHRYRQPSACHRWPDGPDQSISNSPQ